MEENGVAKLNLDDFIWISKGAEAVVRAWAHKKTILCSWPQIVKEEKINMKRDFSRFKKLNAWNAK